MHVRDWFLSGSYYKLIALFVGVAAFLGVSIAADFELAIDKAIQTPGPYASGDTVTYQITVENQGTTNQGSGVIVNDHLPVGSSFTGTWSSSEPSVILDSSSISQITWEIPSIFPTESITIDYTIQLTTGGTSKNVADVLPGSGDPAEGTGYATGNCTPGMNPLNGDEAVAGTNNVDCVEISVSGAPVDGACGSLTEAYDTEGDGDAINQSTPGLCGTGSVFAFSYDGGNHQWTWTCQGENGGSDANCSADELYCGDSAVQTGDGEACDDSNQSNNDGCSATCQFETPACTLAMTTGAYSGASTQFSITGINTSRETMLSLNYGDGSGESGLTSGTYQYAHTYTSVGTATAVLTVDNSLATGSSVTGQCTEDLYIGYCGDGTINGDEACDDGNSDNTDSCKNDCTANVCGDGYTRVGIEQCDDGNSDNNDACKNDCTNNVCGDGVVESGVESCDDGNATNTDSCTNSCNDATCGDGYVWSGNETCDDGNTTTGDGCSGSCQTESCGDGYLDTDGPDNMTGTSDDEACDDGNSVDGDGCSSSCEIEACGDGIVDADGPDNMSGTSDDEACDDGNSINTDACKNDCTNNVCGDGVVYSGTEACDDGNTTGGDGCSATCQFETPACTLTMTTGAYSGASTQFSITGIDTSRETMLSLDYGDGSGESGLTSGTYQYTHTYTSLGTATAILTVKNSLTGGTSTTGQCTETVYIGSCGDGIVNGTEACDDGNSDNTDSCTNTCQTATCGDGYVWSGNEECDDGNSINTDACTNSCTSATCGDGIVRSGNEACDDGNSINGDGCSNSCQVDQCGNGVVDSGEACDDGNTTNTDACTNFCENNICGDGYVWSGNEACDDGNTTTGDGCNASCEVESCGDGYLDTNGPDNITGTSDDEVCDDGNSINTDACTNSCTSATCGDGIVRSGNEACDDGNSINTDACKNDCTANVCGDGVVYSGTEACDDGNLIDGDGCQSTCELPVCGDGIVDSTEECDDGNTSTGDGCDASCDFETPSCSLTITNSSGSVPQTVTVDETVASGQSWISITSFDRGDGQTSNSPTFATSHTYTTTSAYYPSATVVHTASGAVQDSCSLLVEVGVTCGNGVTETGEYCDDGNTTGGDGCSALCQTEGCTDPGAHNYDSGAIVDDGSCTSCGDGIVDLGAGETCDDGNTMSGDGCSGSCQVEGCTKSSAYNFDSGAVVDDGSCRACGDGIVDAGDGEACDDGNTNPTDACTNNCIWYSSYLQQYNRGGSASRGATRQVEDTTQSAPIKKTISSASEIHQQEAGIKTDYQRWTRKKKLILVRLIERYIWQRMRGLPSDSAAYISRDQLRHEVADYKATLN